MARVMAGVAAFFLLLTGVILIGQGHAEEPTILPAPTPRLTAIPGPMTLSAIPTAFEADAKRKEEKRLPSSTSTTKASAASNNGRFGRSTSLKGQMWTRASD